PGAGAALLIVQAHLAWETGPLPPVVSAGDFARAFAGGAVRVGQRGRGRREVGDVAVGALPRGDGHRASPRRWPGILAGVRRGSGVASGTRRIRTGGAVWSRRSAAINASISSGRWRIAKWRAVLSSSIAAPRCRRRCGHDAAGRDRVE